LRYYSKDALNALLTILTNQFNPMIDTIRTERSDITIPYCNYFTSKQLEINVALPQIKVSFFKEDLVEDEILDDVSEEMNSLYRYMIMCALESNTETLQDHCCYYQEAIQRIFQGYRDQSISWIRQKGGEMGAICNSEGQEIYKAFAIELEVRV